MTRFFAVLLAATALLAGGVPAVAQDTKESLKAQFKARDAKVRELKKQGMIGETVDGYVDAVDPASAGDDARGLLEAENADRKRLYQILADEVNTENPDAKVRLTAETMGQRNALRNIERAAATEWLRVAKGHWVRVRDFPRFQKITRLKAQGKVGETAAGLVEVVSEADGPTAALVKEENDARTAAYRAAAEKEGADAAAVAERAGRRNFENARAGEMLKDTGGAWRKK